MHFVHRLERNIPYPPEYGVPDQMTLFCFLALLGPRRLRIWCSSQVGFILLYSPDSLDRLAVL
jgi:hypothetical protein